jgi:YkoY family integral membrane protein
VNIQDVCTIGFLVFMEGILSLDNAMVLAVMVKHLPAQQRKKALTYGMAGAFGFRFLALFFLSFLMKTIWVKAIGGAYLVFISLKHFFYNSNENQSEKDCSRYNLWKTIFLVELMDIVFSADSILASVAVSPKIYIVFIGGILGIIMMRFAASLFVKLLDRFPGFEKIAYLLIVIIGNKLIMESSGINFEHGLWFWVFWILMVVSVCSGFFVERNVK